MSPLKTPRVSRLPLALVALGILVGCTAPVDTPTEGEIASRSISTTTYHYLDSNAGRLVGTLDATPDMLKWAGVTSLEGAVAQAFDPDGTPLDAKVTIDADGHFLITGLSDSRPKIFVEADVNGLRFRATVDAPRDHKDYDVVLDAGSTYLSDKLRRAALDHNVPFDQLNSDLVDQTTEVVNTYMQDTTRREVLEQTNPDLNAYAFDHFMDNNEPVKIAVYQLSPAILRGWTPPPTDVVASVDPNLFPSPTPTPRPSAFSPSPVGSTTPVPSPSEQPK